MIIIVLLIFTHICVNFRTYHRGGRLAVLEFMKGFIFLRTQSNGRQAFVSGVASVSISSDREITLRYHRFGHPNFSDLKYLLPLLFKNKNSVSFSCDICQFAKHTQVPFSPKPYVPSMPFALIYNDI